ncbi:MAG: citrulline utilization hydrolase CtlX [Phycisphaerales bacterium]
MEPTLTATVLAVRPTGFRHNDETAGSNAFQRAPGADSGAVQMQAAEEFDGLVTTLRTAGLRVIVADDPNRPPAPDAVFPNNWISLHAGGTAVLYPMLAPARRREVRPELIDVVAEATGWQWPNVIDLTPLAAESAFVEGTGSLILDRPARIAWAGRSPRTTRAGLDAFADATGFRLVEFGATDAAGQPIYHTNVMMNVGRGFAVICLACIDAADRDRVARSIADTGRTIIEITREQLGHFAGNMLALGEPDGEQFLVMSAAAEACLTPRQRKAIAGFARIISAPIPTIERIGGGSVRCMLAEVFGSP